MGRTGAPEDTAEREKENPDGTRPDGWFCLRHRPHPKTPLGQNAFPHPGDGQAQGHVGGLRARAQPTEMSSWTSLRTGRRGAGGRKTSERPPQSRRWPGPGRSVVLTSRPGLLCLCPQNPHCHQGLSVAKYETQYTTSADVHAGFPESYAFPGVSSQGKVSTSSRRDNNEAGKRRPEGSGPLGSSLYGPQ